MKQKHSIVKEIKRKITTLFSIFLLILVAMVSFALLEQQAALIQEDLKRKGNSLINDFKAQINELIYQLAPISEDYILSSLPNNLLYTQHAIKVLTQVVDNNAMIKSAFINDGSIFTVEGYPFYTLKWNSKVFSAYTNQVLSEQMRTLKIKKRVVSMADINGSQTKEAKLFLEIPLRQKQSSLMRPYNHTGVLFLELDLQPFFEASENSGIISLKSGDLTLEGSAELRHDQTDYQDIIYSADEDSIKLELLLHRQSTPFSNDIIRAILLIISFGLILVALLVWYLRKLSKRLINPMLVLERHCDRLKQGNYVTTTHDFEFKELQTLQVTLNQLAKQIKLQISSLEHEKIKAQSSERAKAFFLANMSHELRTPLNGIYGVFQLMKYHNDAINSNELVTQGMTSTKTLLSLLNDLLDFSKIEAGELKVETVAVNLIRIATEVKHEFIHTADNLKVPLIVDCEKLTSPYRLADPLRLKQILRNLVSNAVKFTSSGEIRIVMKDAGKLVSIQVIDTGAGINEATVDSLFKRFQQADPSTTRKYGGTGLGLAIVKQLTELMGGTICVQSEEGVGSEFKLELNLSICATPLLHAHQDIHAVPQLKDKNLLLAEDNPLNQKIFSAMIKPTQAQLVIAKDGEEAIELYKKRKPDIFFIDIQMPKKDGLEVCAEVRLDNKQIPLIAVTANVMSGELESYQKLGFDACVAKPIDMKKLYEVINTLIQ
ncbi:response regulator [Pseudoalteromonas sp. SCSIO 43201]|uniref:ATP-binding protein n=1 Tax=Pseudoalteromonas sp. SCSIO 43201 TaxID=2822842 RepID=UPI00207535B7|nr:ATP-binding protein [Pseudoalteromonas sp. SCSIO 43201]USD29963.1 response regulator [Pseudoalteromonas sp. SCSIO 43201]